MNANLLARLNEEYPASRHSTACRVGWNIGDEERQHRTSADRGTDTPPSQNVAAPGPLLRTLQTPAGALGNDRRNRRYGVASHEPGCAAGSATPFEPLPARAETPSPTLLLHRIDACDRCASRAE
jgi:hypothetical protein